MFHERLDIPESCTNVTELGARVAQSVWQPGYRLDGPGFESLFSPKRADRLWDLPSLLFNRDRVLKQPRSEVTHTLHLVPRLRTNGVTPL